MREHVLPRLAEESIETCADLLRGHPVALKLEEAWARMLDPTTIQVVPTVWVHLQIMFSPYPTRRWHIVSQNIHSAQSLLSNSPTTPPAFLGKQKTAKRLRVTQYDSYDDPQTMHSANPADDVHNPRRSRVDVRNASWFCEPILGNNWLQCFAVFSHVHGNGGWAEPGARRPRDQHRHQHADRHLG